MLLALILSFLGLTLGRPASELRLQNGDPLLVRPNGISRVVSYLQPDDPSGVTNVTEREGVIFAIEAERERPEAAPGARDPYGVTLGMTAGQVQALRGTAAIVTMNSWYYPEDPAQRATFIYRFDRDVVDAIKLIGSPAVAPGSDALPHVAEARAESYATAVLDLSTTLAQSDRFRERYLAVHDCDAVARNTTTERRDGRTYRETTATCGGVRRAWYFDVTRAAGGA